MKVLCVFVCVLCTACAGVRPYCKTRLVPINPSVESLEENRSPESSR